MSDGAAGERGRREVSLKAGRARGSFPERHLPREHGLAQTLTLWTIDGMKMWIPLTAAALLITACDKPKEKAPGIVAAPKPEKRLKPTPAPEPAPPKVSTVTPQELEAFYADVEALSQQVAPLSKPAAEGSEAPDIDALEKAQRALTARRGKLLAGLDDVQKKEFAKKSGRVVQIGTELMQYWMGTPRARAGTARIPAAPEEPQTTRRSPLPVDGTTENPPPH